jgi:hypothetical protein
MSMRMTSLRRWEPVVFVLGLVLSVSTTAFAKPDPFEGTWILNLAKSKFTPGPGPKNQTVIIAATDLGLKVTVTGTNSQGKSIGITYTANFDGKDYPASGSVNYDTITQKRVNTHTIEITSKKAGKVVQRATNVVSPDGKTRTFTADGTNTEGPKVHSVSVYDKQ